MSLVAAQQERWRVLIVRSGVERVAQRGSSAHHEAGSRSAVALAAGRIGDLETGGRRAPRAAGY